MGAHFHHTAIHCSWDEVLSFRSKSGLRLWGADAAGSPVGKEPVPARLGLVVGNEGAGLTDSVRSALDRFVSIPMSPRAESLNVAVATGILLHEVRT
jgi:tRNA G18 (ribose-2'-O)-methylase SpoU